MASVNLVVFNENLRMTQQYCEEQLLKSEGSKSEVLRSIQYEHNFILDGNSYTYLDVLPGFFELQLAYKKEHRLEDIKQAIIKGRILACALSNGLLDGYCDLLSGGFIDVCDLTPIDTWFYLSGDKEILYSWIPISFSKEVEDCVQGSSTDMFWWIDNISEVI